MNEPMQIVMGALCFGILIVGIFWQFSIWGKMKTNGATATMVFGIPFAIGVLAVMGGITWSAFQYFDPDVHVDINERKQLIIGLAILAVVVVGKSLVGAFLLCATLSWALYRWYQHDIVELLPAFQFVIVHFMSWAPPLVKALYTWILLSYVFISSVKGSMSH